MKRLLAFLPILISVVSALPAERWPNVGPDKHQVVIITPTSESYGPIEYTHEISPKKGAPVPRREDIYHSNYAAIEQHYPSPHFPPPVEKKPKPHYDEKVLRRYYDNYLDSKVAFKKNLLKKVVDKTIDVTAKLTQSTVDFITKVAIETAAKLAKNGADHVIHKQHQKLFSPADKKYH